MTDRPVIKTPVRSIAPFENHKNTNPNNKPMNFVGAQPRVERVARNDIDHGNIDAPVIQVVEVVVNDTTIVQSKKSNVSRRNIENGRKRKYELRHGTVPYSVLKKQNLAELVAEYDAESNARRAPIDKKRKEILASLAYDAVVKSYDAEMDELDMLHRINIDMLKHYRRTFAQMVRDYQIIDVIKKADAEYDRQMDVRYGARNDMGHINPKTATPQQLREYVTRFNNQHKM